MVNTFSGGLVYEFTQEPNNYGLVELLPNNDAKLLSDFVQLLNQMALLPELDYDAIAKGVAANSLEILDRIKSSGLAYPKCQPEYANLGQTGDPLPRSVAMEFVSRGVQSQRGKFVQLSPSDLKSPYKVFNVDGKSVYMEAPTVKLVQDYDTLVTNSTYVKLDDGSSDYDSWDSDDDGEEVEEEESVAVLSKQKGNFFSSVLLNVTGFFSKLFSSLVTKFRAR